ncbi:MAG: amidoligase family protein [Pseudomonadota bacterium]
MIQKTDWQFPESQKKSDESPRRVGVEIELQGIDIFDLSVMVADVLDAELNRLSSAEYEIATETFGTFRTEIDFALLQDLARRREQAFEASPSQLLDRAVELLGDASTLIVPCEVVTPPLPMAELPRVMDPLITRLRQAGAQGTRRSVLFAFGVHFNVEPSELTADRVLSYLRAFVCLYDWVVDRGAVDLSRQLTPYIDRFPKAYELLLADSGYSPDWPELIDDYLVHNATRDRALDMLPMFSHVDERRVKAIVDNPLIKPRPAFHYRLANSCVDEPSWSLSDPWNRWVQIERLASDQDRLRSCLAAFARDRDRWFSGISKRWVEEVEQWLSL